MNRHTRSKDHSCIEMRRSPGMLVVVKGDDCMKVLELSPFGLQHCQVWKGKSRPSIRVGAINKHTKSAEISRTIFKSPRWRGNLYRIYLHQIWSLSPWSIKFVTSLIWGKIALRARDRFFSQLPGSWERCQAQMLPGYWAVF